MRHGRFQFSLTAMLAMAIVVGFLMYLAIPPRIIDEGDLSFLYEYGWPLTGASQSYLFYTGEYFPDGELQFHPLGLLVDIAFLGFAISCTLFLCQSFDKIFGRKRP